MPHDVPLLPTLLGWRAATGRLHERLANAIRRAITTGIVAPGTILPSERALARELRVSRGTVVAAYECLVDQGWLIAAERTRRRVRLPNGSADVLGPATAHLGPLTLYPSLGRDDAQLLDLSIVRVPPLHGLADFLASLKLHRLPATLAIAGIDSLREQLAGAFVADGIPTSEDQILITSSAQQGIALLADLLVQPGDVVAVDDPTYPPAVAAFKRRGARLISIWFDERDNVIEDYAAHITRHRPRVMFVAPGFSRPEKSIVASDFVRLAQLCSSHGIVMIEDAVLTPFSLDDVKAPTLAGLSDSIISVTSVGKILGDAFRIGWIRADLGTIRKLIRLKALADTETPIIMQALLATAVHNRKRLVDDRISWLRRRRTELETLLREVLPSLTWRRPSIGTHLWAAAPWIDGIYFVERARDVGVAVVTGDVFSVSGSFSNYVRLPIALSRGILREGVHRLSRLASHGRRTTESQVLLQ